MDLIEQYCNALVDWEQECLINTIERLLTMLPKEQAEEFIKSQDVV
jgi:hypothetical protein